MSKIYITQYTSFTHIHTVYSTCFVLPMLPDIPPELHPCYSIKSMLSKLFSSRAAPSKLNWSTIEKEAFAIFYTVTKCDFLLRDVKFTIETDHKNLTYLKTAQSAKLRRWQLALQEYDFACIHIAGEANVVTDAFSQLCERRPSFDADTEDKT
jgi:hypothetical protein